MAFSLNNNFIAKIFFIIGNSLLLIGLINIFVQFNVNLLLLNLLVPLLTILFIYLFSNHSKKFIHKIGLYSSFFSFFISICMWIFMSHANTAYFNYKFSIFLIPSLNFDILLGVDGISLLFILLTNLFIYLCILSLPHNYTKQFNEILIYLFLLQWSVLIAFSILDLFGFFIFFEMTLIPIYFIVLIWGSRERKIRASYLISIYTLFGSIFMFFNILYLYSKVGITNHLYLMTLNLTKEDQIFLWLTFFLAFATKIPMFPFHIWLPEAHVEAPTIGSVLLAVLLLKLGTYGIIRFSLLLFPLGTIYFSSFICVFAIASIIYTSLIAMRQIDLKKIIAYSSVGHMNAVLLGIIILNVENLEGAIFQMLSHGIVSGALFFCVGSFYKRYKVRSLKYFGGFMRTYPLLSVFFLIFSMANISFPGTSSFVGEFVIFLGLLSNNSFVVFLASINMVTGAAYTLWAYNRIAFGNIRNLVIKKNTDLDRSEFYLFMLLIFFLAVMGLMPNIVFDILHVDCMNIIEHCKLYV